VPSPPQKLLRN